VPTLPSATARCPLCDGAAYPWISVPQAGTGATVGMLSPVDPDDPAAEGEARLFDRCDGCGTGIQRATGAVDLAAELRAITVAGPDGTVLLDAPNRASWQATVGNDGWSAVAESPGRLLLTRRGMELLAERGGIEVEPPGCPPWGRNQRWMLQTLLNAITLHPNFATRVLRGELRPASSRGRFAFAADLVASALATPLVALLSVPLEAAAALFGRGGRLVARAR
jgi:hypothetical protein